MPKGVPPADGDITIGALGGAVVDLQFAVLQIHIQRLPLVQRIPHRRTRRHTTRLIRGASNAGSYEHQGQASTRFTPIAPTSLFACCLFG